MDLYLLDKSFQIVDVIEGYESAIWTERYDEPGDVTLVFSVKKKKRSDFPEDYYIQLSGSRQLMVIETRKITYSPEAGRVLTVTGRDLTSILNRRIVWYQTNINSMLEPAVKRLLDENVISPSVTGRKINEFLFAYAGSTVPSIYAVEAQFQGEKLHKAITDLCQTHDVGFRVIFTTTNRFQFQLYGGVNRSYEQDILPQVVFSPEYDNLLNASAFSSKQDYVNWVLVGGEGEGDKKKFRSVGTSSANTGLKRYEDYLASSHRSSNDETLTTAQYNAILDQEGRQHYRKFIRKDVFDGETDPTTTAAYGVDFQLGDIVQIDDNDLIVSPARIVEYIISDDVSDGQKAYPALRIKE